MTRLRHLHAAYTLEPENVLYIKRIAQAFTGLGDNKTAGAWLAFGEQQSPQDGSLAVEHSDQLLATRSYDAFDAHTKSWLAQGRTQWALFRAAKAKRIRAREALEEERQDKSYSLLQESYNLSKEGMEFYMDDGHLRIYAFTAYFLVEHAVTAKLLGHEEEWERISTRILDHYEQQRGDPLRDFILTIVHAANGDSDLALAHFANLPDSFLHNEWQIREWATGLSQDPFGVFGGIHNSIAFKDTMQRLRSRNGEQLARVREELPELFEIQATIDEPAHAL